MLQTASEIKAQLLESAQQENKGRTYSVKEKADAIELGQAVKHMTGTKGWKIVEAWILRKFRVDELLEIKEDEKLKLKGLLALIKQVEYWVLTAERLEKED